MRTGHLILGLNSAGGVHAEVHTIKKAILQTSAGDKIVWIIGRAASCLIDILNVGAAPDARRHANYQRRRGALVVIDKLSPLHGGVDAQLVELADGEHQPATKGDVEIAERDLESSSGV